MRGMLGADTARLRDIAQRFDAAGETVARSRAVVMAETAAVEWFGPDADRFRADVDDFVRPELDGLDDALQRFGADLVRQADDQDHTSGAGASSGGSGGGGDVGTPGPAVVDAETIARLRALSGDPDAVNTLLSQYADDALRHLALNHPHLVGPLEGAPYWLRDLANRERLDVALERAEATGSAHLDDLLQIDGVLEHTPDSSLLQLDLDDPDRVYAAIGLGDVDGAQNVSYLVPGINNSVESTLPSLVSSAANLRDEVALAGTGDTGDVATVAWMGYDSGGMLTVGGDSLAADGATRLERTLDGFTAVRPDSTVDLGVVAHSYGSTTTALALSDGSTHGVDRFIAMGSAGFVETRDTNGFWFGGKEIGPGDFGSTQVFVTEAGGDRTADVGRFVSGRLDPRDHSFTQFSSDADGGRPATSGHGLASTDDGVGYLGPGSNSLYNIGQILNGNADPGVDDGR